MLNYGLYLAAVLIATPGHHRMGLGPISPSVRSC